MSEFKLPEAPGRFVEALGHRIHYRVDGPEDGPPLVAIHGVLASTTVWDKIRPRLTEHFRMYCFDLPGHGYSSRNDSFSMTVVDQAGVVAACLEALGLDRYGLMGHSMGGGISIIIAAQHPEKVERLVTVAPLSYPFEAPLKGRIGAVPVLGFLLVRFVYSRGIFESFLKDDVYFDAANIGVDEIDTMYAHFNTPRGRRAAHRAIVDAQNPHWMQPFIDQIKSPMLVVWGEQDRLIPSKLGMRLTQEVKTSRLVEIPNCGHVPMSEAPDVFVKEVYPFFQGTSTSNGAVSI